MNNNIEPTYTTSEQSKLLKDKGFNVECETKFELNGVFSLLCPVSQSK